MWSDEGNYRSIVPETYRACDGKRYTAYPDGTDKFSRFIREDQRLGAGGYGRYSDGSKSSMDIWNRVKIDSEKEELAQYKSVISQYTSAADGFSSMYMFGTGSGSIGVTDHSGITGVIGTTERYWMDENRKNKVLLLIK